MPVPVRMACRRHRRVAVDAGLGQPPFVVSPQLGLVGLDPVGNYAVQPRFSDGHDSGIFSWDYLYHLGADEAKLWADYERRLAEAGVDRDAPMAPAGHSHGHGHGCSH